MKQMKQYPCRSALALLLALLLVALCACSATSADSANAMDTIASSPSYAPEDNLGFDEETGAVEAEVVEDDLDFSTSNVPTGDTGDTGDTASTGSTTPLAEKIIYSGNVEVETTRFDSAIRALEELVAELGGFVESSNTYGNTSYNSDGTSALVDRYAWYTVRIPSASFDEFMNRSSNLGNVVNSGRSAQNVTSQYTDYEARLSSLTIQEERLLEMLAQSGDLESLIALEARLSEVRYEIESIERSLRDLDQRLAYSDVTLHLYEVAVYTPTVSVTRSFGERMSDALSDGWQRFTRTMQDLCLGLASSVFNLVLLAVVVVIFVVVFRQVRRRRAAKKAAKAAAKAEMKPERKPETASEAKPDPQDRPAD